MINRFLLVCNLLLSSLIEYGYDRHLVRVELFNVEEEVFLDFVYVGFEFRVWLCF